MAEKTGSKHLTLRDKFDREIVPKSVRAAFSGDVFLSYSVEDIPPPGARVELRVQAIVMPVALKAEGEEGMGPYHAVVPLKAREARNLVIILPEPQPTDQSTVDEQIGDALGKVLPEGADSVTVEHPASGTKVTVERSGDDGPRRSAQRAKAARAGRTPGRPGGRRVGTE